MFNSVEYVRSICRQRGIPVSALEKACGFSNGYLNPKKLTRLPYDRAVTVANYLQLPTDQILTGTPTTDSGKTAVTDEDIKFALFGGDGEITEAMYDEVKKFAAFLKARNAEKKE